MILLEQAYGKVAQKLGDIKITRILDAGSFWIFMHELVEDGPKLALGVRPFAVNKDDGVLWIVPHPPYWTSVQRAAINNAKQIAVPQKDSK